MIEAGEAMAHERTCYAVTRADLLWIYAAMSAAYPTPDLGEDEELAERTKRIADDTIEGPVLVPTGDLRALLARIEALHAEREKLRAIISRAERIIQAERDVLVECHSCPPNKDATDYDPDIREDVEEMDVVLRDARAALNASPKDSPDAP
jgi:hypothetical protein